MGRTMFAALFLILTCAGCGTHWQSLKVEDVSYRDLYDLTLHVIDDRGFKIQESDINSGSIISQWNYEKLNDRARFPIRRKVEARIDEAGDNAYLIKIRIDQEANWEGYRVIDPRTSDTWDEHGYDEQTEKDILYRIDLQVRDFEPSEQFYERHRKARDLKSEVPDVLEEPKR
jgi:hypothetical protein